MKKIASKAPLLLAGVAVLLLAWGFAGASSGGDEPAGWREQGLLAPPGAIVHSSAEERPPADYPFSDPSQYWPITIYTDSEAVRQLVVSQAPPAMGYVVFTPFALHRFGFVAWVSEPLIPLLEQHSEVERVGWGWDNQPDQQAGIPEDRIVASFGSGRPPEGYPFSDPKHYRGIYIFTKSRVVRELVAVQALPSSHVSGSDVSRRMVYGGKFLYLSEEGFAAWVPEPLIPVLEAHPEVERLGWDVIEEPLGFYSMR